MSLECQYIELATDYVDGTMPQDQEKELLQHLKTCENCARYFNEMEQIHQLLLHRERIEPRVEQLYAYQTRLERHFPVKHPIKQFWEKYFSFWRQFHTKHRVLLNWFRAFALIVVGMIIGKFVFQTSQPQPEMAQNGPDIYIISPGDNDYKLVNEYVTKTEILLLAIKNSSNRADRKAIELQPEKQLANDLLQNLHKMQVNELVLQDKDLDQFLSRLELVLLEVSNSNDQDMVIVFREMKKVIDNTQLVSETRKIQQKIAGMI